jgi:hypothetical protein
MLSTLGLAGIFIIVGILASIGNYASGDVSPALIVENIVFFLFGIFVLLNK